MGLKGVEEIWLVMISNSPPTLSRAKKSLKF